jgi:SPP1 family predicted phage head-tail adaptor
VRLQSQTTVTDPDTGYRTEVWADVAPQPQAGLPAEVVPLSGREFIAAAAQQSKVSTRITIRWRAGVNHLQRLLYDGRVFNIEAVLPDNRSGREWLTLMCSEGVNDG